MGTANIVKMEESAIVRDCDKKDANNMLRNLLLEYDRLSMNINEEMKSFQKQNSVSEEEWRKAEDSIYEQFARLNSILNTNKEKLPFKG